MIFVKIADTPDTRDIYYEFAKRFLFKQESNLKTHETKPY